MAEPRLLPRQLRSENLRGRDESLTLELKERPFEILTVEGKSVIIPRTAAGPPRRRYASSERDGAACSSSPPAGPVLERVYLPLGSMAGG